MNENEWEKMVTLADIIAELDGELREVVLKYGTRVSHAVGFDPCQAVAICASYAEKKIAKVSSKMQKDLEPEFVKEMTNATEFFAEESLDNSEQMN